MKLKNLFILTLPIVLFIQPVKAQIFPPEDITGGDTLSFENNTHPLLTIDTNTIGIWQIGIPSKLTINSAYDGNRAIITDTLNAYDTTTYSSFQITIPHGKYACFELVFWHWYETTAGKDGGKIEISYNMGSRWINVIDYEYPYAEYQMDNMYGHYDSIENFGAGFSGISDGWVKSRISWSGQIIESYKEDDIYDTTLVRFVFSSDSIPEESDGWAIDRILLFYYNYSAIENLSSDTFLTLFPNPFHDILYLKTDLFFDQIILTDMVGRELLSIFSSDKEVDLSAIRPGIYRICIYNAGKLASAKLINKTAKP